jgi:tetratricopeptide (TPR) repeat protein
MKYRYVVLLFWTVNLFAGSFVYAQDFAHSYAVVIGIDNYQYQPHLAYAVKDARAMAQYLRSQGYTEIIELYDRLATKNNILEAMQNNLAPKLRDQDRVLIFFAGHGYTELLGEIDRGYIIPFDGASKSAGYISMDELANLSSYMGKAKHQLFIMDSCYGGIFATRTAKVQPSIPGYISEIAKRPARQVLTAGGKGQRVLDNGPNGLSFFMGYLMEALQGAADLNGDGYITFSELEAYIGGRASNAYQTPSSGTLPGHGAGEYLFRLNGTTITDRSSLNSQTDRGSFRAGNETRSPSVSREHSEASSPASASREIPTSQKIINDPVEYNAYIKAFNIVEPAAKSQAMESFAANYPHSVVNVDAMEQAMAAYQEVGNVQKVEQFANAILQKEPNNVRALAIIVFFERARIKDATSGGNARTDAEHCLQLLPNWNQPEGYTSADFQKIRGQITNICASTAGFGALQQQDYPAARSYCEQALMIDPNDLENNYRMAIALLQSSPMNPLGFWYGAKAVSLAQQQNNQTAANSMSRFFTSRYKNYHGDTADWSQRVATASTQTAPPTDFVASIPLAPTACDLAARTVQENGAGEFSFSDWELVLSCRDKGPANKIAADQVWQTIQAKQQYGQAKLKIPVKVVAVPNRNTLEVAVSDDNQPANKTDMRVVMEKSMSTPPAPGTNLDVIGVLSEYTVDPFLFVMTRGELPLRRTK